MRLFERMVWMKALYLRGRGELIMDERSMPIPRGGEVVMKVARCGVCHTDINNRSGMSPRERYGFIIGHEFSGVVTAVGDGVQTVRTGDRGITHQIIGCGICRKCVRGGQLQCEHYRELGNGLDGGFAEYCVMPEKSFFRLPDHVTFEQGTMVEPLANALCALRNAEIMPGDTVVVIGPGPIGIMMVRMAILMQAGSVVLVGTRDARLEMGRRFGASHIVNIRESGAEAHLLQDILGGRGADAIIDASGSISGLELAFKCAVRGSRVCLEGSIDPGDRIDFSPHEFPSNAQFKKIAGWRTVDFRDALTAISDGQIDVDPLITHILPFAEWEKGFDLATHNKDDAIKVVLSME